MLTIVQREIPKELPCSARVGVGVYVCLYIYVYRCIYRITIYVTFSASGSAGKGSRPVDIGPDYKPPLGGKCCYKAFQFKCSNLWYFRVMRQPTKNTKLFTTQTKSVS